jgi:energy-coupling factor transport system ATP-binding protein
MRALQMRDVCFTYEGSEKPALSGVDLDVEQGEFVTLLGRNGSGKSTICMLANGLIPHAIPGKLDGRTEVFGLDIGDHSVASLSTRVGIVFQEPESQLFCMSVEEEVAFGPENLAVPREEIVERVEWALSLVGMKGSNERSPYTLSGGEKQRVAIAAALSMRPSMLILDEPAYALDPAGRVDLYSMLRSLKDKLGMAVLLAERDAEDAAEFSDRIVLMEQGKILRNGPPREVLSDPEMLDRIGLEPTQLGEVASLLEKRLPGKRFSFLTVEEAEAAIVRELLSGRGGVRR